MSLKTSGSVKKKLMQKLWRWVLTLAGIIFIAILGYWGYWHTTGNIHVVVSQQVMRSASLTPEQLKKIIQDDHIRSIIDLAPGEKNYQKELEISRIAGVQHFELSMRAHGLPPIAELKKLTLLLQQVPRPVLIHCRQGADRTGLGAAIALILTEDATPAEIQHQYSMQYGAVSPSSTGKLVMHYYFIWLQQHNLQSRPQHFLRWLQQLKVAKDYPYSPRDYHN